jgi:ubiquinol-cytochrome c reductase cytochrome b subunit
VKSIRYRGWQFKIALTLFAISFITLGYLGAHAPTPMLTLAAQFCSMVYFLFFLLMPLYTRLEKTKPVPERVTP